MYLSLNLVEDLLGLQALPLNNLLERLSLAGFEIESVSDTTIRNNKYLVLNIDITANRADVSSLKGLIFEIFSLCNSDSLLQTPKNIRPIFILREKKKSLKPLKFFYNKHINYKFLIKSYKFSFFKNYKFFLSRYSLWEYYLQKKYFSKVTKKLKTKNYLNCDHYVPLFNIRSEKIKIKQSPYWIRKRLLLSNFQITNNIIDTLNYLMLETGQVFFAYDINKLERLTKNSHFRFISKYANNNDLFPISESKIIKLNNKILTLTSNNTIISITGLLQNFHSLVTMNTSEFLIHGGLYNASTIKYSMKTLGIRTEYSLRLEKQIDLNLLEQAYLRLIYLFWVQNIKFQKLLPQDILMISNKKDSFLYSYIKLSRKKIKIFYNNIKRLIGPYKKLQNLDALYIIRNLKFLNFKINYRTDKNCYLIVPLTRQIDIEREVDIIEEIVRSLEFDKFSSVLPTTNKYGNITKIEKLKRRLKTYLLNFGFHESLHSILQKKTILYQTQLKNPLYTDSSVLRISLLNDLIKKVKLNKRRVGKPFETFEFGRIYKLLSSGNKEEIEILSGILGGKTFRSTWENKGSILNWFEAKGILEDTFSRLNFSVEWIQANFKNPSNFHPNRTTNIIIGEQIIGTFGQIHPSLVFKTNIARKIYLFELNIEILNKFWQNKTSINYLPYSSYPTCYIDLSCIANKKLSFSEIKEKIYTIGQPLLKSIKLFDYYTKAPIKKDYCSLSFKLEFKSKVRTLLNSEITFIINLIITNLEKKIDIKFQ